MNFPKLISDNKDLDQVYETALRDIQSNIKLYLGGVLLSPKAVFIAGEGYREPWTRDAAINVWNGLGLFAPEISKNTLMSVLKKDGEKLLAGGEYWDAIIWVTGAYAYYLFTGDEKFKSVLTEVAVNSLEYFENTEFDEKKNLFRGGACYGDGVSAYPDFYAASKTSGIKDFVKDFPQYKSDRGEGNPMMTLSTNCLYHNAYKIAAKLTNKGEYEEKAEKLKTSINNHFWNEKKGNYNYIVDVFGGSQQTEGLGVSFALLFNVASEEQAKKIVRNTYVSKQGVPCLYPEYERYKPYGIGRHCGTVWSHINAFWGDAVMKYDIKAFEFECRALINRVLKDGCFREINHPETGKPYGGVQEWKGKIVGWKSECRQLWCATGYLKLIFKDLLGLGFTENGLAIRPVKTKLCKEISVTGIKYRNAEINITVKNWNGEYFVPKNTKGKIEVEL